MCWLIIVFLSAAAKRKAALTTPVLPITKLILSAISAGFWGRRSGRTNWAGRFQASKSASRSLTCSTLIVKKDNRKSLSCGFRNANRISSIVCENIEFLILKEKVFYTSVSRLTTPQNLSINVNYLRNPQTFFFFLT